MSDEDRSAIKKLKEINSEWGYFFYDLEMMRAFINENYPERYLKAFDKINPDYGAAKSDYFRYLIINKLGGCYLDVKAFTDRPLNKIINSDDELVVFFWDNNPRGIHHGFGAHDELNVPSEFQQWNIFSSKGNKYLNEVVEQVTLNIEKFSIFNSAYGRKGVLITTGPIAYTNAINDVYDGSGIRFAGNNESNGVLYRDDISFPERILTQHYSELLTPIVIANPRVQRFFTMILTIKKILRRERKKLKKRLLQIVR